MERARVFLAVGQAVIEHDRSICRGAHAQVELGEHGEASLVLWNVIQICQHRYVAMAVRKVLCKVTRFAIIEVRFILLPVHIFHQLERLDIFVGIPGDERRALRDTPDDGVIRRQHGC